MKLNYNPRSGHVKRDGAVIGRVELGLIVSYVPYRFAAEIIEATDLKSLLAKVREVINEKTFH